MPARQDFAAGEFCWIDLNAHDLEAAVRWYGDLFGWAHEMMPSDGGNPPYAFFVQGEAAVGGIGQMSDEMKAMGIPPMWNSYVCTEDCEATEAKVKELGGTVTVPTMEVPGKGKLAFFLDPEGASFAAWQTTSSDGQPVLVREPGGLCWNELMTRDAEKAKAFYGELTAWSAETMPMGDIDYVMLRQNGEDAAGMMPMAGPQFEGVPAHWLVYFMVEDCAATAAKVEASGGKVLVPPTQLPVGTFASYSDPQGGVFATVDENRSEG
ncbi:MAG: VOC family protein [Planctomycetota bacterium]